MMTAGLRLSSSPVQMATVTSFNAPDPWNGDRPSLMTLSVYRMVNDRYVKLFAPQSAKAMQTASDGMTLSAGEALGLRSSVDGRYHMLPTSITRLWQKRAIRTEDLPRIVAEVERNLPTSDYSSARLNPRLFKPVSRGFAGLGALLLLVAAFTWLIGPPSSHIMREMSTAKWLAQPQRKATIHLSDPLTIGDSVPIGYMNPPKGFTSTPDEESLGWYQAADGKRLTLVRSVMLTGVEKHVFVGGSVVPLANANVPAEALARLTARTPGLRTDLIMLPDWRWNDGYGNTSAWSIWLYPGLVALAIPALMRGMLSLRERHFAAQEAAFEARFARR